MALPEALLSPNDDGYETLYEAWEADGRAVQLINHQEGWVYRVHTPDAVDRRPVFALECSSADLSVVMGTKLQSWGRRGSLPIEDVNPS